MPTPTERDAVVIKLRAQIAEQATRIAELRAENNYLAYFHRNADFGPAHTDVVMSIQRAYEKYADEPVPATWLYE